MMHQYLAITPVRCHPPPGHPPTESNPLTLAQAQPPAIKTTPISILQSTHRMPETMQDRQGPRKSSKHTTTKVSEVNHIKKRLRPLLKPREWRPKKRRHPLKASTWEKTKVSFTTLGQKKSRQPKEPNRACEKNKISTLCQ